MGRIMDSYWLYLVKRLKMGDAVKEYTVTASTDFKSATLSREKAPYYWTSRDPITVSAWWPFNNADITQMPAVKVAEDQSLSLIHI